MLWQRTIDRPPTGFGVHVGVELQPGLHRLGQKPRTNTHDPGQGISRTEDGRSTHRTENPGFSWRGFVALQKRLPRRERQFGGIDRNIGGKRPALRTSALGAVANLDGSQRTFDDELDAFTQARSMVFDGHHIVLAQRTTGRIRRIPPPSLQLGPDFFPRPP